MEYKYSTIAKAAADLQNSFMAAGTLKCPMCGASASSEATGCEHCGARLATVACPSCFGLIFRGAKYCSHCGASVHRQETNSASSESCPRCRIPMSAISVGTTSLHECERCEGVWVDASTLERICADREKQAAVLSPSLPLAKTVSNQVESNIRYVPCPACGKLMNRVNFARCSQVVVDVCAKHGTWFDKDELRRIIEFIRGGGLEVARNRAIAELEAQRRQLKAQQTASAWDSTFGEGRGGYGDASQDISAAVEFIRLLWDK